MWNGRFVREASRSLQERLLQRDGQHAGDLDADRGRRRRHLRAHQAPAATARPEPSPPVRLPAGRCLYPPSLLQLVDVLQLPQRRLLQTDVTPGSVQLAK